MLFFFFWLFLASLYVWKVEKTLGETKGSHGDTEVRTTSGRGGNAVFPRQAVKMCSGQLLLESVQTHCLASVGKRKIKPYGFQMALDCCCLVPNT